MGSYKKEDRLPGNASPGTAAVQTPHALPQDGPTRRRGYTHRLRPRTARLEAGGTHGLLRVAPASGPGNHRAKRARRPLERHVSNSQTIRRRLGGDTGAGVPAGTPGFEKD